MAVFGHTSTPKEHSVSIESTTLRRLGATLAGASFVAALAACQSGTSQTAGLTPTAPGANSKAISPDKKKKAGHPGEIYNQIIPYPCGPSGPCPTNFEAVFAGDVTNEIPSNEPLYGHFNPFCPPSQGLSNPCPPTIVYNPTTNTTTVTYSGPTLYLNSVHQGDVHFALMSSVNDQADIKGFEKASYWSYPSSPNVSQPIASIASKQPAASPTWAYAIVYLAGSTTPGGPATYGTWNAIAYVPKTGAGAAATQPRFTFKNFGSAPIYVTSSGVVLNQPVPTDPDCIKNPACSENLDIESTLNEIGFPPPGTSGSPFVPLQYPPAKVLKPQPFDRK
jgi:hypothetical protein